MNILFIRRFILDLVFTLRLRRNSPSRLLHKVLVRLFLRNSFIKRVLNKIRFLKRNKILLLNCRLNFGVPVNVI